MNRRYLARRLVQVPLTAGVILVLTFLLIHLAPGDPVLALAGQYGDADYYAAMRERFGLDRPLPLQLVAYAGNVLQGEFGTSFTLGRPALTVVLERLPATLLLGATALVLSTLAGTIAGLVSARYVHRTTDAAVRSTAILGYATPSFWLGQVALLVLAFGTGLFPTHGMTTARAQLTGVSYVLDVLHHLALPGLVLAATELALTTRLVRSGLIEAFRSDYVRTGRASGLRERTVTWWALRNGLLPALTVIGARTGMLLAGATLVEIVFAWPGVGRLLLTSAQARDYPVLLAIFLLLSFGVIVVNLITDLIYALLDPRIRYA